MVLTFHEKYSPITSRPFLTGRQYTEYQPCEILRPYVSCYWCSQKEPDKTTAGEVLVIPDTCLDVIIHINHTKQTISGYLCSIQDEPFISSSGKSIDDVSVFAVRFYFWAAHLFLKVDFKDIANQKLELDFLGHEWKMLSEPFFYLTDMGMRIRRVEQLLVKKLETVFLNAGLFNSFQQIIVARGGNTVKDICEYSCISQRQMERQFLQTVGLPMKRISSLVRYQNVWKDIAMSENLDIQDAVYRYGYSDQAHLLKDFKRFHGTTIEEARRIACLNR